MKVCEEHIKAVQFRFGGSCSPIRAEEDGYRAGWRAVLEWLEREALNPCATVDDVQDVIEAELED